VDRRFVLGLVRDWGIALVVAIALFGAFIWFFGGGPVSGSARPLRAVTLDGEAFELSALEGRPVIVNFWATWCGPCKAEIPELSAFARENPDITLLGVSVDEGMPIARLRRFVETNDMAYTVVHDPTGASSRGWGVSSLPTTYALSPDGHIVDHKVGRVDRAALSRMVAKARAHAH
jgi:thiol-disulfide isomerase/thioredoxin